MAGMGEMAVGRPMSRQFGARHEPLLAGLVHFADPGARGDGSLG